MDREKVIMVTGGSKRIGAEIAKYFHNRGFKVIIHFNKSAKEAESLKKNLLSKRKGSCLTIQADFFDKNSISKALKEMLNRNDYWNWDAND